MAKAAWIVYGEVHWVTFSRHGFLLMALLAVIGASQIENTGCSSFATTKYKMPSLFPQSCLLFRGQDHRRPLFL